MVSDQLHQRRTKWHEPPQRRTARPRSRRRRGMSIQEHTKRYQILGLSALIVRENSETMVGTVLGGIDRRGSGAYRALGQRWAAPAGLTQGPAADSPGPSLEDRDGGRTELHEEADNDAFECWDVCWIGGAATVRAGLAGIGPRRTGRGAGNTRIAGQLRHPRIASECE